MQSTQSLTDIVYSKLTSGSIRQDFPILSRLVYGKPLIYFDNAATTQKPHQVIDAISKYYYEDNANVHRGVHYLSQQATNDFESVRKQIAGFINAGNSREIIFTKGTTDSINLVAAAFGRMMVNEGDEIVISAMEHHANIVPWQMLCEEKKAHLRVIPVSDSGELDLEAYVGLLTRKTRLVAITHVSNTLGTINPVKEIVAMAHSKGIPVLLDGAQGVSHMPVDVQDIDCDFYCFSGHKLYGPMGIGVLYGKEELLERMPPYQGGGEMIDQVTFEKTTYNELPYKFEAGTPNVADVIGFGAAISYITGIGLKNIGKWEAELLYYAKSELKRTGGVTFFGEAKHQASVISFLIDGIHPYDAGTILDHLGIAVRTGTHCTQPLMDRFGISGTIRASLAFYNTRAEIDGLVKGVEQVKKMFS
jgi:cysteine desulfurase / selenocysteine lyase